MSGTDAGLNPEAVAVIVATAIALATAVGTVVRRMLDGRRTRWRNQDRTEGWVDAGGRWHPGAVDLVMGWDDDGGVRHAGLDERTRSLEDWQRSHEEVHAGPGRIP